MFCSFAKLNVLGFLTSHLERSLEPKLLVSFFYWQTLKNFDKTAIARSPISHWVLYREDTQSWKSFQDYFFVMERGSCCMNHEKITMISLQHVKLIMVLPHFSPNGSIWRSNSQKKCKSMAKYLESKTDVYRKKLSGSRKKIGIIQSRTRIYDLQTFSATR